MHTRLLITATVISSVLLGGCGLVSLRVQPTPTSQVPTGTLAPTPTFEPSPSPTPEEISTPSATPVGQRTTKGGLVEGTSTHKISNVQFPISNSLFTTSFGFLEVTNFPGQTQNASLILTNNSNNPALYAIKLAQSESEAYPVNVNGTNEITGTMAAHSNTTVSIGTMSAGSNPNFSTSFTVNFTQNGRVVSSPAIKVIVHTPINDSVTMESTGDASMTINYAPLASYGVKIINKHGKNINFSASVEGAGGNLQLTATNGYLQPETAWFTSLHFTSAPRGGLSTAKVIFTFTDDNHAFLDQHTLTVNVQ